MNEFLKISSFKLTLCLLLNFWRCKMNKFIWFLFGLLALLQGCASTVNPRGMAESKKWNFAYAGIDTTLSQNKIDPTPMIDLAKQYPEIIDYAQTLFTYEELSKIALQVSQVKTLVLKQQQ